MTMNWSCSKKLRAREATIITPYRELFGSEISEGKEYWTLSGLCVEDGLLVPGCEIDQISRSGLARPDQFHAVERDLEVYDQNRKLEGPHWYHGDIYKVMRSREVNPAVVNLDLLEMPDLGSRVVADTLWMIAEREITGVMVVANFVLEAWSRAASADDIFPALERHATFRDCFRHWELAPACYEYAGTGNTGTRMGTVLFWRR